MVFLQLLPLDEGLQSKMRMRPQLLGAKRASWKQSKTIFLSRNLASLMGLN